MEIDEIILSLRRCIIELIFINLYRFQMIKNIFHQFSINFHYCRVDELCTK